MFSSEQQGSPLEPSCSDSCLYEAISDVTFSCVRPSDGFEPVKQSISFADTGLIGTVVRWAAEGLLVVPEYTDVVV
jgi:hypothetical protein